jgi:TolB-like protein
LSFFEELKRRNVFRVSIAYLIVAWLIIQVADVMIDNIGAPDWLFQGILLVLGIGFPIAVFFSWVFEVTPDGVKREADVDRSSSTARDTGRKLDRGIIVVLVIALGYFIWDSQDKETSTVVTAEQTALQNGASAIQAPETIAVEKSVAVLPFQNMSSDPEQEYFSDGITEEIINALVKIPGLSVPARTSVFAFKGEHRDVRGIGKELGVAHVLEGSIRSQNNQVRITAQLIKVDDGFHLWSETFDRELSNIFKVQEEIAAAISQVIIGELGLAAEAVPNQTINMEAYDTYLKGRAALRKRDDTAIELFELATKADPGFAPAWAALAIAHQSINNDLDPTLEAAQRALSLDPDNVDALDAMGSANRTLLQWHKSERYFDSALAVDPNSVELLEDYAEFLTYTGRAADALRVTTQGMQIDDSLIPLVFAHLDALMSAGMVTEARTVALNTIQRFPLVPEARMWLFLLPVWLSPLPDGQLLQLPELPELSEDTLPRNQESMKWVEKALEQTDEALISTLRNAYSVKTVLDVNEDRNWSVARDLLVHLGETDYVIDVDIALLGESSRGFDEWIWTPFHARYRQHPRFAELLEQANLISYWDATQWPSFCERDANQKVMCQ